MLQAQQNTLDREILHAMRLQRDCITAYEKKTKEVERFSRIGEIPEKKLTEQENARLDYWLMAETIRKLEFSRP